MLGPSGSGKTTCLRMIAGFELPTSGRILLHGADVSGLPPYDRDVNTVFQDYALFPHMTVADNVGYSLMVGRRPEAERRRRVDEALALVRLEGFGGRKPSQLSGGQRQRVALARALDQPPLGPAARRTAGGAGPQAPPGDADRVESPAAGGRDHLHLRDPRPGGSLDDERPAGGLQSRPGRAGRTAGRGLRESRSTHSWPASWAPPTSSPVNLALRVTGRPGPFTVRPEKISVSQPQEVPRCREPTPSKGS